MNTFEIHIKEPKVQEWFNFLYLKGALDETIERITKYYIDFCLTVNEKELEDYFDIVPYNEIFRLRSPKSPSISPHPIIDIL